jgi:hypothetical protein
LPEIIRAFMPKKEKSGTLPIYSKLESVLLPVKINTILLLMFS